MSLPLRYAFLRAELWASLIRARLAAGERSQALHVGLGSALTSAVFYKASSMKPALSASGEALLVRNLLGEAERSSLLVGDLVLCSAPDRTETAPLLVRRVTAVAGDELENSSGETKALPQGHVWLECDSAAEGASDSRTFGPVALSAVRGRVIYGLRSEGDHGTLAVGEGRSDDAVLAYELDLEKLLALHRGDEPAPKAK
jgi:hypothetical protein